MAIGNSDLQSTEVILQAAANMIGGARWRLTLDEFCHRLNVERDDYWKEKFIQWAALADAFSQFDSHTLARLCVKEDPTPTIRVCSICGGSDGEHDWETHTMEMRAEGL